MSHVARPVDFVVSDLDALEAVLPAFGAELMRGQTTHRWYGRFLNDWNSGRAAAQQGMDPKTFGTCDHAIRLKGGTNQDYEVGLTARADGTGYDVVFDTWGPGRRLEAAMGQDLGQLRGAYRVEYATRKLRKRGLRVSQHVNSKGQVVVRGVKL